MRVDLVVVDTNVLISSRLLAGSVPARVLEQLRNLGAQLLFSTATLQELDTRLRKPKFQRYASTDEIDIFMKALGDVALLMEPEIAITACRDGDDNRFLELATEGEADCIITGDNDLLVLHPFQGIPVLSPADFLNTLST